MKWLVLAVVLGAGCSSVLTVRLAPDSVAAGPGLRPIAGIQTSVSSFYVLFVPIPGGVNLERVVNRMLIVTAKTMGADKVAGLRFHVECPGLCLSKLFGVVTGYAEGIAVQVEGPPPDPKADDGPESH